ncbi:MAG: dual specificity protein phosphatase family protein [Chlamydiia bacterium]|nr:dual specificity protein phosphatase family protein [Chlamydiia bacterium]
MERAAIAPIPTAYKWDPVNVFRSPTVRTLVILTSSVYVLSRFAWAQKVFAHFPWKIALPSSAVVAICAVKTKPGVRFLQITRLNRIVFEILLTMQFVMCHFGIWKWTTEIEPGIYLSALPLQELEYKEWILEKNISVLALIDKFELTTPTLIGRAIDYKGVDHQTILTPDFLPPNSKQLDDAVYWINSKRQKKITVLIHCKAGSMRSASALAAYYIKKQGMSADEAREKIAAKRPTIYGEGSSCDRNLKEFAAALSKTKSGGGSGEKFYGQKPQANIHTLGSLRDDSQN